MGSCSCLIFPRAGSILAITKGFFVWSSTCALTNDWANVSLHFGFMCKESANGELLRFAVCYFAWSLQTSILQDVHVHQILKIPQVVDSSCRTYCPIEDGGLWGQLMRTLRCIAHHPCGYVFDSSPTSPINLNLVEEEPSMRQRLFCKNKNGSFQEKNSFF